MSGCNHNEQTVDSSELATLACRLSAFYDKHAPELVDRVPIILDAYREWPLMMFPDIDAVYGTNTSLPAELEVWRREPESRRHVRVKVAQDYIYLNMHTDAHLHEKEKPLQAQARLGAKFGANGMKPAKAFPPCKQRLSLRRKVSQNIRRKLVKLVPSRLHEGIEMQAPQVTIVR
jgi:hypothetical protein